MNFRPLAFTHSIAALLVLLSTAAVAEPLPEFTHRDSASWLNSPPLTLKELQGKVVLLEFWTFDCVNCLRSLPWLKDIATRDSGAGLVVIGVHTPELPQEKVPANVAQAIKTLGIRYPVMLDADYSYWNRMKNRYWPAFYLIGKDGQVAAVAAGEMHSNEKRAQEFEKRIRIALQ